MISRTLICKGDSAKIYLKSSYVLETSFETLCTCLGGALFKQRFNKQISLVHSFVLIARIILIVKSSKEYTLLVYSKQSFSHINGVVINYQKGGD